MQVTKWSWKGGKPRVLRLSDDRLSTFDPADNRLTNSWRLADVVSAEVVNGLTLKLRLGGMCAACGVIAPQLSFSLPNGESALAMRDAIQAHLCRMVSPEASAALQGEIEGEMPAVLEPLPTSALPVRAQSLGAVEGEPSPSKSPEARMQFDVSISITKARGLPQPPIFYSNPIVECVWGESEGGPSGEDITPSPLRQQRNGGGSSGDLLQVLGSASSLLAEEWDAAAASASSAPVLFRTEPAPNHATAPRWGHDVCFRYSATPQQLQSRLLVLKILHARPLLPPAEAARTLVRLHDIAVGPVKYDLPLRNGGGREVGRIVFTVRMMQKCKLAVSLPAATCTMRGGARHTSQASQEAAARSGAFSLTAALTVGEEGESEPIRTDFDQATLRLLEAFNMQLSLPPGGARSAIHVLASAKALETESLHLRVWRGAGDPVQAQAQGMHKSRLVGEVWLPLTKVYTPGDHAEVEREFSDVLWLHGQRVGRLAGMVRVLNGPRVVQLSGGFYTENGVVPVGPIHQTAQHERRDKDSSSASLHAEQNGHAHEFEGPPKGLALPKEVEALLSLVQTLKKLLLDLQRDSHAPAPKLSGVGKGGGGGGGSSSAAHDDIPHAATAPELPQHARARAGEAGEELTSRRLQFLQARLQTLLGLSNKESCKAFFYASAECLEWTQRLMLKLWSYLLTQAEHLPYKHQPGIFETLHLLVQRGELDHAALFDAAPQLMERYSRTLWDTVAYVMAKLNRKAAPTEVRVFCSQALAIALMRLPALRGQILPIILPPGENRHKHVGEWNLSWSLHKSATNARPQPPRNSGANGGTNGHPRAARRHSDARWPEAGGHPVNDPWADLWGMQPGPSQQNGSLDPRQSAHERALQGKYWRERLRKRGHCFFLLLEHWVRHVPQLVGVQPGETIDWKTVPGFPQLIKAFLLEMKQRPVHVWPESMRSCVCALVQHNRQLTQVFARILLARVSANHLRPTVAALKQLAQLMDVTADEPLPLTFDFELLLQPLRLTVKSQHFKVGACALIFVYNHVDKLGEPSRLEMLQWLHSRFAWFGLHWSRVVRSIFLHIVVMKVLHYDPAQSPVPRRHTPDAGLASSRSESDIFAPTERRLGLTVKASSASSLSMVREVEYARLIGDFQQSIHALQQLCDGGTGEACAILHLEEGCTRALRSYAGMAWEEFCALEKKWEELQEMLSKYHPDEPLPMSRSRNSSRNSMGSAADAEGQPPSRSSSHEQIRPLRTPTLSMDAISDDHDEDEGGGTDDEW